MITRFPNRGLLIVFLTVCIDLLGFAIVLPLLPRYGKFFLASELTLGLLMASFSAMQFVFAPIWGRVSDSVGRKPVLTLGLFANAVFYGLFGYVSQFPAEALILGLGPLTWLFLARLGAGVASATIPTAQAYIADTTDQASRGKGMALIGAAFGVGFTIGPLIGAFALPGDETVGPSAWPGYIAASLSLISGILALVLLKESRQVASSSASSDDKPESFWTRLRGGLRRPTIGPLLLTIFISTFAFAEFETTLSLLTAGMGVSDRYNFFLFAFIGLVLVVSQGGLVRRLIPKLGEKRVALIGTGLMAMGLGALGLTKTLNSIGYLYAVLPLCVIGFSFVTPSLYSMLSLGSHDDDQGGMLGIGQSMSAIARIFGPIVGLSLMTGEHLAWPYVSASLVMMLAFCLIWRLPSLNDPLANSAVS